MDKENSKTRGKGHIKKIEKRKEGKSGGKKKKRFWKTWRFPYSCVFHRSGMPPAYCPCVTVPQENPFIWEPPIQQVCPSKIINNLCWIWNTLVEVELEGVCGATQAHPPKSNNYFHILGHKHKKPKQYKVGDHFNVVTRANQCCWLIENNHFLLLCLLKMDSLLIYKSNFNFMFIKGCTSAKVLCITQYCLSLLMMLNYFSFFCYVLIWFSIVHYYYLIIKATNK